MEEALTSLDVTDHTLTEQEKKQLDEQGFLLLTGIMESDWIHQVRESYETLMRREGQSAGMEVHQETGTRRLADLVNKGEVFDRMYTHPKVLAGVYHILKREFNLSSLNARDAVPGQGHQALHADWGARTQGEPFHVVNSIWLIDEFTADNGATRVVPGTQHQAGSPGDYMSDPQGEHPDQQLILAPAGSVAIFNAHVWHGGTTNRTATTRRACHAYYTASEHEQQLDQKEYIRKSTYDRITEAARYLLNV
ncbi:hypothetical protein SY83_03450 [Paenibacillus swuensis]|uniref:Phytanoyl-CoA dioxygenase n=1 Tax=Paenibacillus swuensis TaxID=1178515 RepID=A0A172TNT2_9BACL|nr:hypothetical protein SY83_03450 [Paenibacillus swuensis]